MENSKDSVNSMLDRIDQQIDRSIQNIAQCFLNIEDKFGIEIPRKGNNYFMKLLIFGHMRTDDNTFYRFNFIF